MRAREAADVRDLLAAGTLHDWAAHVPGAREYVGREFAYGVSLPSSATPVVVRHARHGGLLAAITGDVWMGAGRAPHELTTSTRLAAAGVPTPEVVAYALYPVALGFSRIDVLIEEIANARDLAAAIADRGGLTDELLEPVATLLATLARAGARHEDLNLKNILVTTSATRTVAWAIDVDRVTLEVPRVRAMEANVARVVRSARKWRRGRSLPVEEHRLAALARRARELGAQR
ncbi:MAG TPA: lipopolysaccharide kinase InaA family protein [Gemmatimonadaceae bacterium]|nr:lipopolysaccharide kinase InaA family protein [Gemmatimonadaceae bacterium]